MNKTIRFTKKDYDYFNKVVSTKKFDNYNDYCGYINIGAVNCEFVIIDDPEFKGEDYCYGDRFVLDAKFYLLGKDTGYGEKNGIPYDCVSGFYVYIKDTYEKTLEGILDTIDKCLNENPELKAGSEKTDVIWDKVMVA